MQQAPKAPTRGVGVGVYDVNQELYTQADMSHTIAEHVKRVREKEIQVLPWILFYRNLLIAKISKLCAVFTVRYEIIRHNIGGLEI